MKAVSNSKSGFTLIELLVAATIIGVLTAIAVINYSTAQRKARDAKRKVDLESIRGALEMRKVDFGTYPGLIPWGAKWEETLSGNTYLYMQSVPQDPKYSTYKYSYTTTSSAYELCAYLESGGIDTCTGADCGSGACNYKVLQP